MITVQDNFIRLNVWETANNASYVTLTMALEKNDAHPIRNVVGTLRIGGKRVTIDRTTSANYDGAGTVLYTWSASIPYDNDNVMTLTTSFEGSYEIYNTPTQAAWNYNSVNRVGYYTATRPVTKSISTNKSTVTLGTDSVTITTSGGSSGALTWKVGNNAAQTIATVGNTTTTWSPTLATAGMSQAMSSVPNSASMTCTLTWNGVSKNITLKIPDNSSTKPSVSIAMAVAGSTVGGLYVQGKSNAKATVTANGKYGATIPSTGYSISLNGQTYTSNPATSGLLNTAGTNTCTVTVTDSRGFQSTASQTFTVTAYSSPKINNVSIYRSNASNIADVSGTYITFKFTPAITALANNNAKNYGIEVRQVGSSWPSPTTGVLSSYTAAATYTSAQVSATTLYEARAYIQDSFEKVYSTVVMIPTAEVIMDFNTAGTGGGIGMYTQKENQLDIAWNVAIHGDRTAMDVTNGLVFRDASNNVTASYPADGMPLQDLESKNLIHNTEPTQTKNGLTFTMYANGTVWVSGTATADTYVTLDSAIVPSKSGSYILSGCPSGGAPSTYRLYIENTSASVQGTDYGSTATMTLTGGTTYRAVILVRSGTTMGKSYAPMLRKASVADSTYVPYAPPVSSLPGKLDWVQLLDKKNIPTTETAYTCNYSSYGAIAIVMRNYSNFMKVMEVPTNWFLNTTSGQRIYFGDSTFTPTQWEIRANGSNSVYIKASAAATNWGVTIYGIRILPNT